MNRFGNSANRMPEASGELSRQAPGSAVVESVGGRNAKLGPSRLVLCWRLTVIVGVVLKEQLRVFWPTLRAHRNGQWALRDRYIGEALAQSAEALGPVFTKAAQAISYRADLLPESLLAPLARLQEQVRPSRPLDARRTLAAAMSRPVEGVFTSIDERPIASGSIATVYRAITTLTSEAVAVKIVRPGVAEAVALDIACLRMLIGRAARTSFLAGMPVMEIFESIAGIIVAQCDMSREACSLQAFAQSAAQTRGIGIPGVRTDEASGPRVLVMEYFGDGLAITSPDLPEWRFRAAALHLLRFLYRMIFIDGFVHCDLHPGNIRVRSDGSVYLFDAGLVATISATDRECFREFFVALANGDAAGVTLAIVKSAASVPADLARVELEADVADLVGAYSGRNAGSFLVAEFVYRIFNLQKKYRLYGAPGFVSAIWALLMFEGLVRNKYPELDFQAEARPYAIASLLRSGAGSRRTIGTLR
jgi:ubiquinone biosynthesis protein